MKTNPASPVVPIACGGTGGHLFPGIAIAEELQARGATPKLLVSDKAIDQAGLQSAPHLAAVVLPAVGLSRGRALSFVRHFWTSWRFTGRLFDAQPPSAVLGMGGFTSAPAILSARSRGARTFIHEANSVPGRANRFLARLVDEVFIYFPQAEGRLKNRSILRTGMPVRSRFQKTDPLEARAALGLDPKRPVLLIMGGSQGAHAVNQIVLQAIPMIHRIFPDLQYLHLTGESDDLQARAAYANVEARAVIRPFLVQMDLALAAATLAVSRAGASSLAEFAAMGVPALLIPYPAAVHDHQLWNARAFASSGAACCLEQRQATPETLIPLLTKLMDQAGQQKAAHALEDWHFPMAAQQIAGEILARIGFAPRPAEAGPRDPLAQPSRRETESFRKKELLELAGT